MKTLFLLAALAGVTVTPITESGHGGTDAVFSPDGKFVAYHDGARTLVREVSTGVTKSLSKNEPGYQDQTYSADGKELYFTAHDSTRVTCIFRRPVAGGAKELFLANASSPRFSSDGKWIAYQSLADRSHPVQRVVAKVSTPREGRVLRNAYLPSFSPDSKSIAFVRAGEGTRTLAMAELEPWVEHTVDVRGAAHDWDWGVPTWSPDSQSVIAILARPGKTVLATVSMATGEIHTIASWPGDLAFTVWPGSDAIFVMARQTHGEGKWQLWSFPLPTGQWTQVTNARFGFVPYSLHAASDGATLALLQSVEAPRDWWDGMWDSLARTFDPQTSQSVGDGPHLDARGPMFDVTLVQIRK